MFEFYNLQLEESGRCPIVHLYLPIDAGVVYMPCVFTSSIHRDRFSDPFRPVSKFDAFAIDFLALSIGLLVPSVLFAYRDILGASITCVISLAIMSAALSVVKCICCVNNRDWEMWAVLERIRQTECRVRNRGLCLFQRSK